MAGTSIEWTDHSINPLRAQLNGAGKGHYCEKISAGCKNCYSSRLQPRLGMPQFQDQRGVAGITHHLDAGKLREVLGRKKPTKFFWCDMTDMFGSWVAFEHIAACFGVMAATPQHTHQVLTKRPERALAWFAWIARELVSLGGPTVNAARGARWYAWQWLDALKVYDSAQPWVWPLPNVHVGVSVENQATADERLPILQQVPAAVRFVSAEPLLGPLDLTRWLRGSTRIHCCMDVAGALRNRSFDGLQKEGRSLSRAEAEAELKRILATGVRVIPMSDDCEGFDDQQGCPKHELPGLDWIIVGGESGQQARPFHVDWARDIVKQCAAANVACFVKQLGARPLVEPCRQNHWDWGGEIGRVAKFEATDPMRESSAPWRVVLGDRKGGDMSEWPESLRVRQFPEVRA